MCVIMHKPAGVQIPDRVIETAIEDNPDGWGVAFADAGFIHPVWGFRLDDLRAALADAGDRELAVHFRWATHGKVDILNCHPFLTRDGRVAVMHNGVISDVPMIDPDRSDTYHFVSEYLDPVLAKHPRILDNPRWIRKVEARLGSHNKVLILTESGRVVTLNRDRGIEVGGVWYSNGTCLTPNKRSGGAMWCGGRYVARSGDDGEDYTTIADAPYALASYEPPALKTPDRDATLDEWADYFERRDAWERTRWL